MTSNDTTKGREIRYEDLWKTDRYAYVLLHSAMGAEGRKVKKGDVVVPTEWGRQNLRMNKYTEGVVTGNPKGYGNCISVRPKGRKTAGRYWAGFWRKKKLPEITH